MKHIILDGRTLSIPSQTVAVKRMSEKTLYAFGILASNIVSAFYRTEEGDIVWVKARKDRKLPEEIIH
jgi:hypothetical protein